jgi:hypothetical protein
MYRNPIGTAAAVGGVALGYGLGYVSPTAVRYLTSPYLTYGLPLGGMALKYVAPERFHPHIDRVMGGINTVLGGVNVVSGTGGVLSTIGNTSAAALGAYNLYKSVNTPIEEQLQERRQQKQQQQQQQQQQQEQQQPQYTQQQYEADLEYERQMLKSSYRPYKYVPPGEKRESKKIIYSPKMRHNIQDVPGARLTYRRSNDRRTRLSKIKVPIIA